MPNEEERETKCHHNLVVILNGVVQGVMHNLYLHVRLRRVSPEEDAQPHMHIWEVGVARDKINLVLWDVKD